MTLELRPARSIFYWHLFSHRHFTTLFFLQLLVARHLFLLFSFVDSSFFRWYSFGMIGKWFWLRFFASLFGMIRSFDRLDFRIWLFSAFRNFSTSAWLDFSIDFLMYCVSCVVSFAIFALPLFGIYITMASAQSQKSLCNWGKPAAWVHSDYISLNAGHWRLQNFLNLGSKWFESKVLGNSWA